MTNVAINLTDAINAICEHFNEPYTAIGWVPSVNSKGQPNLKADGSVQLERGQIERNHMSYQQENLLRQLRINATYMQHRQQQYINDTKEKLEEQLRSADGSEINMVEVRKLGGALKTAAFRMSVIEPYVEAVTEVYEARVDTPFEMPKSKPSKPSVASSDQNQQFLAELAQLGVSVPSEISEDKTLDERNEREESSNKKRGKAKKAA